MLPLLPDWSLAGKVKAKKYKIKTGDSVKVVNDCSSVKGRHIFPSNKSSISMPYDLPHSLEGERDRMSRVVSSPKITIKKMYSGRRVQDAMKGEIE